MPRKHRLYMQRRPKLPAAQPPQSSARPYADDAESAEPNRLNVYTCQTCGGRIVTIDRHVGTTPFTINCRATPGCDGVMYSSMYQVDESLTPTWEWFKPGGKFRNRAMREHVEMGGLDLRRIEAER